MDGWMVFVGLLFVGLAVLFGLQDVAASIGAQHPACACAKK